MGKVEITIKVRVIAAPSPNLHLCVGGCLNGRGTCEDLLRPKPPPPCCKDAGEPNQGGTLSVSSMGEDKKRKEKKREKRKTSKSTYQLFIWTTLWQELPKLIVVLYVKSRRPKNLSKGCPSSFPRIIMAESLYNPRIIRSQRYRPRNSPPLHIHELSAEVSTTASENTSNNGAHLDDSVPKSYPRRIDLDLITADKQLGYFSTRQVQ